MTNKAHLAQGGKVEPLTDEVKNLGLILRSKNSRVVSCVLQVLQVVIALGALKKKLRIQLMTYVPVAQSKVHFNLITLLFL